MADYTVSDALVALKEILMTASAVGQSPLAGGYVLPDDAATGVLPQVLPLPCITVSEVYNTPNDWTRKAEGTGLNTWKAEVLLFVAPGPLTVLNAATAAAMLKTRNWAKAFADRLNANQSLNGKALVIGEHTGGNRRLFRYGIGHVFLDATKEYWGMRLELAIQQRHTQQMSA